MMLLLTEAGEPTEKILCCSKKAIKEACPESLRLPTTQSKNWEFRKLSSVRQRILIRSKDQIDDTEDHHVSIKHGRSWLEVMVTGFIRLI